MTRTIYNQFVSELYDTSVAELLINSGFTDTSWGNDACPSFEKEGNRYKITVFIECIEQSYREVVCSAQFSALIERPDDGKGDQFSIHLESECYADLVKQIKEELPDEEILSS